MNFTRRTPKSITSGMLTVIIVAWLISPVEMSRAAEGAKPAAERTAQGALAVVQEMARAMRENDADGIERLLADDWAVISARGGLAEGKSVFSDGIKSGYLTRKTFDMSEPRVRLYGNIALVTTKLHLAGTFGGKPFDVKERESDVLHWKDGGWKIVLTHESFED
jgi:ketosteroid isomerase-like protein